MIAVRRCTAAAALTGTGIGLVEAVVKLRDFLLSLPLLFTALSNRHTLHNRWGGLG